MIALLKKEWREHRGLVIGLFLAAPVVSVAIKALAGFTDAAAGLYMAFGVPSALAVFLVAIAADLVAADSSADRHRFAAALPVRPSIVWAAKVAFLVVTGVVFLAWLVLFEELIFSPPNMLHPYANTWVIAGAPVLGAATLFWSTLIDRGFTAAFGALFTVAAAATAATVLLARRYGLLDDHLVTAGARIAPAMTVMFLAGSFGAFVFGRIHLGCRLRRVLWATGLLVSLLVPAATVTILRLEGWVDLRPGDPDLRTHSLSIGPAGDWVFKGVHRNGTGPLGAPGGLRGPCAMFAVHTKDGRTRDIGKYGTPRHDYRDGEAPGHVRLLRQDRLPDSTVTIAVITVFDLEAGEPVSTRPLNPHRGGGSR